MRKRTKSILVGTTAVAMLLIAFMFEFAAITFHSLILSLIGFVFAITYSEMKTWYGKCRMEEIDELFDDINSSDLYL